MKSQLLLKITIALISLVSFSHVLAQNKVVVIPMFDTEVVFTGVGKTGDAKCSEFKDPSGNWQEESCANTSLPDSLIKGQDAELKVGAEVTPRFTINGDGTVTDNLTGLIWLRDAFCAEQVLGNTWEEALGFIVELNTTGAMNLNPTGCGDFSNGGGFQTDWRLPNVKELQSLLYYEHDMGITDYPFLSDANGGGDHSDGDPFQNVRIDEAYWSSTNYGFQFDADLNVNLIDDVLAVNFGDAVTDGKSKNGMQHVWAVRTGN